MPITDRDGIQLTLDFDSEIKTLLARFKAKAGLKVGILKGATQSKGFDYRAAIAYLRKRDRAVKDGKPVPKPPHYSELETNLPETEQVAEYAFRVEFGNKHIPPRPFMRNSVSKNKVKWFKLLKEALQNGMTPEDAFYMLGEVMKADIVYEIEHGQFAPNSPLTVELKRLKGRTQPDKPLVDTGVMEKAIDYEVMKF